MSSNPLDTVVLQKEKEWREAFRERVQTLEDAIAQKDKELKQEKLRFRKLKEDFEYNLKLIIERDEELERYDAAIGKVKEAEHVKIAEVSELCVRIDELRIKLENEHKSREELQNHYQRVSSLRLRASTDEAFSCRQLSAFSSRPLKTSSVSLVVDK